jgi:energy-coupling factor transport system substrate-specific component
MDFSYVLGEMERGRGTQFDPQFVDILLKLIRDGTINLNKIYHVSKEESDQAETEAAERAAESRKEAGKESGNAAGSVSVSDRKEPEQGGKA